MKIRRIGRRRHTRRSGVHTLISQWCARVVWALLPVTAGTAFSDATVSWSTAPARRGRGVVVAGLGRRNGRVVRAATVGPHVVARRRAVRIRVRVVVVVVDDHRLGRARVRGRRYCRSARALGSRRGRHRQRARVRRRAAIPSARTDAVAARSDPARSRDSPGSAPRPVRSSWPTDAMRSARSRRSSAYPSRSSSYACCIRCRAGGSCSCPRASRSPTRSR